MFASVLLTLLYCLASGNTEVVNRTCQWKEPRAAVIQDALFLDGGVISEALFDTSTLSYVQSSERTSSLTGTGIVFKLYFNTSFSVKDDFGDIFVSDYSAGGLNDNPPFRNGFMFADDYEYYTFGSASQLS
jgi:hypothetical protein